MNFELVQSWFRTFFAPLIHDPSFNVWRRELAPYVLHKHTRVEGISTSVRQARGKGEGGCGRMGKAWIKEGGNGAGTPETPVHLNEKGNHEKHTDTHTRTDTHTQTHTHTHRTTRARTSESNGWCLRLKLWDASCNWVFWGVIFKCSSFLRKAQTSMLQISSGCPETTITSWNTEDFSQNEFIMQPSFLRFWFSSYPVFSEFHGFSRSLCSNARSVALKQRQVLEKLKKITFSQNEIYPATEFSQLVLFRCPSVLRIPCP